MFEHVWSRFQDQKDITFTLHQQQQMAQSQLGPQEKTFVTLSEYVRFWCMRWEWIACDVTLLLCLLACWLRRQWCDLVWSSSKGLSGWRGRKGPKGAERGRKGPKGAERGLQELSKGETDRVFSGPWKHWQHQGAHFMESQVKRVSMYWYGLMWWKLCLYNESCVYMLSVGALSGTTGTPNQ